MKKYLYNLLVIYWYFCYNSYIKFFRTKEDLQLSLPQISMLIEEVRNTGMKIVQSESMDMYYKRGVGTCFIEKKDGIEHNAVFHIAD